jgi:hypothetical protein
MIDQSLKSNTKIIKRDNIEVVYNLIFKNAFYSLECYKEGCNKEYINNYCLLEELTDDEGEAETFLHIMARGKVFPVHIKDMAEDYF